MKHKFITLIFCMFLLMPQTIVQAGAEKSGAEKVTIPVIMYHSILNTRKSNYIVSKEQMENDLIAFKKAGFTSVFPSEIISWQENNTPLPEKPVLITFDDGHYNNMYYALPLLKKHNMKALINVIGAFSEFSDLSGDHSNPSYSHLTWAQIKELSESGYFEIGNHSYNMHKYKPRFGVTQKYYESDEDYIKALESDILRLQKKLEETGTKKPVVFAYPFGAYNKKVQDFLVASGFKMMLTCNEGINLLDKEKPEKLLSVKRYNRNAYYSSLQVVKIISSKI